MSVLQDAPSSSADLPPYDVRVSARARRLQIKVLPSGRVEVVAPRRLNPALVPQFVREHRDWIERALRHVHELHARHPHLRETRPKQIDLRAIGASWDVDYADAHGSTTTRRQRWQEDTAQQRLTLHDNSEAGVRAALGLWLNRLARRHLVPWLQHTSAAAGLSFNRVQIRAQRTRWGSCSREKNINLNRNLLFLPTACVRYLLVHELCHTVHLNHSRRYWSLVARLEPDYRQLDAQLRDAQQHVPLWALPD